MARGKWFIPYKRNRLNYEDVGADPYYVQHDIGFSGDKLFRAVRWNGPNSGTFTLVGEVRSAGDTAGFGKRATAADTRKAHAKAVADARRLAGGSRSNPMRHFSVTRIDVPKGYGIITQDGQAVQVKMKDGRIVSAFTTKSQAESVARQLNRQAARKNPSWRRTVKRTKKARKAMAKELGHEYVDFPSRQKQSWIARGRKRRGVPLAEKLRRLGPLPNRRRRRY